MLGGNIMEKRILTGTRQYHMEEKSLLLLEYYMIEKPISSYENYYGIEINCQTIIEGMEHTKKHNSLLISSSKEWVEELIDKFIANGVTPSTMAYIIDDIMGIPC